MIATLAALLATTALATAPMNEAAFLAKAKAEPGMVVLPGVSYKVLKRGPADGVSPNRADSITVRYVGRFMDGTVFNTSADGGRGTTTFELSKLIPGWVGALRLMKPGDQWRLYIPAWLAYGHQGKPTYIPPDATLMFEVELVSVTPAPPAAPVPPPVTPKPGARR